MATNPDSLQAWVNRDIRRRTIDVTFLTGAGAIAQPLTLKKGEDGGSMGSIPPTIPMEYETAQQLMDELWNVNVRPSDVSRGGVGDVEALKAHIVTLKEQVVFLQGIVQHQLGRIT